MEDIFEEIKKETDQINIQFWVDIALAQFKRYPDINLLERSNEKDKTATNQIDSY